MSLKPHKILFRKRLNQGGFTLMEVMFATMAFALILLVMQMTFSGVLGLRNRAQKRVDQQAILSQAMTIMKRDLEFGNLEILKYLKYNLIRDYSDARMAIQLDFAG